MTATSIDVLTAWVRYSVNRLDDSDDICAGIRRTTHNVRLCVSLLKSPCALQTCSDRHLSLLLNNVSHVAQKCVGRLQTACKENMRHADSRRLN